MLACRGGKARPARLRRNQYFFYARNFLNGRAGPTATRLRFPKNPIILNINLLSLDWLAGWLLLRLRSTNCNCLLTASHLQLFRRLAEIPCAYIDLLTVTNAPSLAFHAFVNSAMPRSHCGSTLQVHRRLPRTNRQCWWNQITDLSIDNTAAPSCFCPIQRPRRAIGWILRWWRRWRQQSKPKQPRPATSTRRGKDIQGTEGAAGHQRRRGRIRSLLCSRPEYRSHHYQGHRRIVHTRHDCPVGLRGGNSQPDGI